MKNVIAAILCLVFVSTGYAVVQDKPEKPAPVPSCAKDNSCVAPEVTPEPKDRTKTHHDGNRTY